MVTRADFPGTRPLNAVDTALPIRSTTDVQVEVTSRLNQIAVGKQVQAEVLSHLDGGTFLVRIDGTDARVSLPATTRIGDQLNMTMLSTQPRPTFLLGTPTNKDTAQVSQAGRLLDTILHQTSLRGGDPTLRGTEPLLAAAPLADAGSLALLTARLQETVTHSGLFYESHLQQWVAGQLPLERLMRAPQPTMASRGAGENSDGILSATDKAAGGRSQGAFADAPPTDADTLLPANAAMLGADTLSAEAMQMVSRQIHTLEQRQLSWQGECWPGQSMTWEIEDQGPEAAHSSEPRTSWMTSVRFTLPQLGQVQARIRLTGEHAQMQITVADEAVAERLRSGGAALTNALAAAGTTLDSLLVAKDAHD